MRQLSCLEELTRLTLEQRRDVKNTKDKIKNFPSKEKIKNDLGDTLQTQRQRRKTLCHGKVYFRRLNRMFT